MHLNLCAVNAAHTAFFSIQPKYCTLRVAISLSRFIMVLQMMVLSETVVVLAIHKACDTEETPPSIQ